MKTVRDSAFIFFLFLFLQQAAAQNFFFKNLTEADGLPDGYVNALCEDKQGFIWIGSHDGLFRYDGNEYEIFRSSPNDSTTILSNNITNLLCDRSGNIWSVSEQEGVSCLNTTTGKFHRFPFSNLFPDKHFHGYVSAIKQGPDGKIYAPVFGFNAGLFVFDSAKNKFSYINLADENKSNILDENNFWLLDIYFKNDSIAYLGTWNGLVIYNFKNHKPLSVHRINLKKSFDYDNNLKGFFRDKSGTLWVGTWGQGIAEFNEHTGKLTNYFRYSKVAEDRIFATANPIAMKSDSEIWLTGWGLYTFNINSKLVKPILPVAGDESSPLSKLLIGIQDKNNNVWFGGITGISIYSKQNQIFNYVNLSGINFSERTRNNLMCTSVLYCPADECYYYFILHETVEGRKTELLVLNKNKKLLKQIPFDYVAASACSADGTIYISADSKLKILDRISLTTQIVVAEPHDIYTNCLTVYGNRVFLGGDGYCVIDLQAKKILSLNLTAANHFFQMTISADGKIWAAAANGIFQYETGEEKFLPFEQIDLKKSCGGFDDVRGVCFDNNQCLWFAVQNFGLVKYDFISRIKNTVIDLPCFRFANIFQAEGNKILVDQGKGISIIDANSMQVLSYGENNGMKEIHHEGSLSLLSNGEFWAIWSLGFINFNPMKSTTENNSPIVFTAVNIFNTPYSSDTSATMLHQLTLQHNQNFFSVKVALLNYINADQNKFLYRLIGLDTTWINNGKNNQISFSGLSHGTYNLQVRAIDATGIMSNKIAVLTIVILPAWWQTDWFRLLVFCLSATFVYSIYRVRISQIRAKEKLKSHFNQKVAEVEMQALRAQMNPHFIFNCLNSINRYIVKSDKETASEYVSKFSRLIRLVLDNSQNNLVPLDKELEQLELYIEMEQMRFENKFDFVIDVSKNVDASFIEIPPLLIQPYVENAIWHGLMHRAEKGFLKVKIEMQNENTLCVFVEDNGVGRKRAEELKSKSATHKSHGMQVTNERLNVYNKMYNMNASVEIFDLENGAGTSVKILIPLKK